MPDSSSTASETTPTPWALLLCAGLILGLSLGVRHAQGIFLLPMTLERGWSREDFALALALQNLVWGLAQPLAGLWADRHGSRAVLVSGLLLYGLGLWGMTLARSPEALWLTAGLGVGLGLAGTAFGVVYGALSRLLAPAGRSAGLGLAGAIGGLGQFVLVPLAQGLIERAGWSGALLALAALCALALAGVRPIRDTPAPAAAGQTSLRAALAEAASVRGFWLLNAGFLVCGFQLAFIASHLPAYLLDQGLGAAEAVRGLALIALANVAGTWVWGWLGGRGGARKHLLSGIYLVRAASMAGFVLLPLGPASLYLFCAVMGFVWLGTVPLTNALVAQLFGLRHLGTLFGLVFLSHQIGSFLGVWLGGKVFEATHAYQPLWLIGIALGLLAALLHQPIDEAPLPLRPARLPA